MTKLILPMLAAACLALAGCQSTPGSAPAATSAAAPAAAEVTNAPATFDIGKKKIFLTANTKVEQKDFYSNTNKGSFTDTNTRNWSSAVLIRQNGNNLLIADPDNQEGTVFVNDQSVKSSGSISGKGKTVCSQLVLEEGYKRNICSSYTYSNGVVQVTELEKDPSQKSTTNRSYKFSYDGDSCKFISFSETTDAKEAYCDGPCLSYYGGKTKWRYTIKVNSVSGSCSIR
ncbi:hypothetical protein [Roseibium suaedae]|uniref:Lipoprotein n=1 Tax=Roseibium suaedae TaxID=735517 RepID=A0A1M7HVM6_9HYPH|nr:hypothetical protein [Roseibium suaedae]SHM32546.1 hypothetical protein SAMN05444272_2346 [Roseibium suaedae]